MPFPPRIAAVIIALNEQENLPDLLAGLDWVDQVVVVDGGSGDATLEIARDAGATVALRAFDNYARQRNHALDLADADWVLSIDADERPSKGLPREVRERIAEGGFDAFRVPIRSTIFGRRMRYGGTQDDLPIRLFRRGAARWQGDVHETLSLQGRVGRMKSWLDHYTLPDLDSFREKMDRYTSLEARARVGRRSPPRFRDRWIAPPREIFRRLIWKMGILDGPEGWAFGVLSGWSESVLAAKHRELWNAQTNDQPNAEPDPRGRRAA
ncbi:MAG: glycosyltransferase family 2 protein [Planctomycetales bacterium]